SVPASSRAPQTDCPAMTSLRQYASPTAIASGAVFIALFIFLFQVRSNWNEALARFERSSAELTRLERLTPYPNSENVRELRKQVDTYRDLLRKLEGAIQEQVLACPSLAPSEFQARLRVAVAALAEKAKGKNIHLPDKFHLGFDEYATGLPNETAALWLNQE